MKIGYFDCHSGISGDMTLGAIVDAGVPLELLDKAVRSLGVPGLFLEKEEVKRHGFRATKVHVRCPHEHVHRHLHHITEMIDQSDISIKAKSLAKNIFTRIAEAEAKVHGTTPDHVHFHEVGAADSIADIVGAAVGLDVIGLDAVDASPIPTGTGTITIAHGTCSVPAPATAELLQGIPLAPSNVAFELTTPTGAAILKTIVRSFGPIPAMSISRIGYGAGGHDLAEQPNLLRLLIGETTDDTSSAATETENIWILETNLDDLSGELIGHCISRLWTTAALDVYTTPIAMKKNRPATKLTVLCQETDISGMEQIIFEETGTLGIRRWSVSRTVLKRKQVILQTPWGEILGKTAQLPDGTVLCTPEYESAREMAEKHQIPLRLVYESVKNGK